jgi:hypothetical protein
MPQEDAIWKQNAQHIVSVCYRGVPRIPRIDYVLSANYVPTKYRVIAIDLDGTLGTFQEVYALWIFFNDVRQDVDYWLHLFPEFFRDEIWSVFRYLLDQKEAKRCQAVWLYTNNRFSPWFPRKIIDFIHSQLPRPLFDDMLGVYKTKGMVVEKRRRTNNKTYGDFIQGANLPVTSTVCFVDDQEHPYMRHPRVTYVKMTPYQHLLTLQQIVDRVEQRVLLRADLLPKLKRFLAQTVGTPSVSTEDNPADLRQQLQSFFV